MNFEYYFQGENLTESNINVLGALTANNVVASNIQASNLGSAAFCNWIYASPLTDGVITSNDFVKWDAGGSNFDTLTANTIFTGNLQASNLGSAAYESSSVFATPGQITTASNAIALSLGSAAYVPVNTFATPATLIATSNDIASSLGSAAYAPNSSFMAASNLTYASDISSGLLLAADWARFNTSGGLPLTQVSATLPSQHVLTTLSGVFGTTMNLSITLPAGVWLVTTSLRGAITPPTGQTAFILFRLFNITSNAEVANSRTLCAGVWNSIGNVQQESTGVNITVVTLTSASTIRVEPAWNSSVNVGSKWVNSDATNGFSRIHALRLA
jgi:hypothetical protein